MSMNEHGLTWSGSECKGEACKGADGNGQAGHGTGQHETEHCFVLSFLLTIAVSCLSFFASQLLAIL